MEQPPESRASTPDGADVPDPADAPGPVDAAREGAGHAPAPDTVPALADAVPGPGGAPAPNGAAAPRRGAELRTFLIADIRGYTSYTEEEGDEAAAALAGEFAALVELIAGEFEGVLLEVRGDEALTVFFSARQALRAAVELQARSSSLARPIGIGLDAGEAIPVGNGYRGTALNIAARLCAQAKGGDIVASEAVIHMAARIDGVAYVEARTIRLKGLEEAVRAVTVVPESKASRRRGRSGRRNGSRLGGRRVMLPAVGLTAAAALIAIVVATGALGPGPFGGGSPSPTPRPVASQLPADISLAAPALALLDAETGALAASVPARAPGEEAVFADGFFWQLETSPTGILKIDPATGAVVQTVDLPIRDPGGFAVDGTTLWVADRSDARVVHIDALTGLELPELRITSDTSDLRGVTDVLLADASAWVARPDPGEVVRLDPATGRVMRSLPIIGAEILTLDGDTLWVLSRDGRLSSIDIASSERSDIRLELPADDYFSLAAGGGSVWTAGRRAGTVYRIAADGRLDRSFETGAGAQAVSFADGTLWVGNQHAGTVTGIDALTNATRDVAIGHTVVGVAAGAGRVLVGAVPLVDPFAGLEGTTLRIAFDGDPMAVFDPPHVNTWEMFAISDATCAKLLRYPERPAPDGWVLEPEIAEAMPTLSEDRLTYTFRLRDGFTFYPSGEPITAETYRASLERALSPGGGSQWTWANQLIGDVKGTGEFASGTADHVEGIVVTGDELSITLQSPAEDFLTRLALPQFCPVPPTIRAVEGGVNPPTGLPSAGPYYLARKERDYAILERNPTYAGSRKAAFDNIAIVLNQDVRTSIAQVDRGELDYIVSYADPALDPHGELAATHGPGSAEQRYFNGWSADLHYLSIEYTAETGVPTADPAVRRAIALALDRPRLAKALGALPGGRLLPPSIEGSDRIDVVLPTDGPDVDGAKALMAGRTGTVRLIYRVECETCGPAIDIIRESLAAIGLTAEVEAVENPPGESSELGLWTTWQEHTDPVRFLDYLPSTGFITDLPQEDQAFVNELGFLLGDERIQAAADLAERWATEQALEIPIAYGVSREYFSAGVGCQVFPPAIFSVDLVTLCPKEGS